MGFRSLRVINEDKIASRPWVSNSRSSRHVNYHLHDFGALEHKDSMGNYDVIRQREIQHMSAGSGIRHSEYNASDSAEVHVLQIWIEPGKNGIEPEYTKICA